MENKTHDKIEPMRMSDDIANVITQFVQDLCITFPEHGSTISEWWGETEVEQRRDFVWNHCLTVFPESYFDVMCSNSDIFLPESKINVEFLPRLDFRALWNADISETTKTTIWKYLQIIGGVAMIDSNADFSSSESPDDLQAKLQEMMEGLKNTFLQPDVERGTSAEKGEEETQGPKIPFDFKKMEENLESLMKGKIGKMAEEMAKEAAEDLDIDLDNVSDISDVMKKFMSNPAKLMEIAKKCGEKLKAKMDAGEISEEELKNEVMNLMKAMNPNGNGMDGLKEMMAGMGVDINSLMKKFMGMGQGKKNVRMDVAKMDRAMRQEDIRQRMRSKIAEKQEQKIVAQKRANAEREQRELAYKPMTDEEIALLSSGLACKANQKPNGSGKNKGKKKKK